MQTVTSNYVEKAYILFHGTVNKGDGHPRRFDSGSQHLPFPFEITNINRRLHAWIRNHTRKVMSILL